MRGRKVGLLTYWRTLIGSAFLLAQLTLVLWTRMQPVSFPTWAPNDYFLQFRIGVKDGKRALSDAEIYGRYHLRASGLIECSPAFLLGIVESRERELSVNDPRAVTVTYQLNGHAPETWRWPAR
jgi:hypothetical protein